MSNYWHNNNCDVYNQLYNVPILMKRISRFAILVSIVLGTIATGCNHNRISTNQQNTSKISEVQENLINDGWYIPKSHSLFHLENYLRNMGLKANLDNKITILTLK